MQHNHAMHAFRQYFAKKAWRDARRQLYAYDGLFLDNQRYATWRYLYQLYLKG